MDPEKKRLLVLAGIGVVVLYLFSRKGSGTPAQQAATSDPLQAAAQQIALQKQQQQASLDYSLAQVKNQIDLTDLQFAEFKKLAADKQYACPNGGRPRWIPGQGPGCIGPKSSSGGFLGGLIGGALSYFTGGRVSVGGGGSSTPSYTPPIAAGKSFY